MKTMAAVTAAARRLPLEPYAVDRPVNRQGRYELELSGEFPLAIKRLAFHALQPKPPLTWHAYQEVFVPLSGECRLRMGETTVNLSAGDILVMDHLKLHAVAEFAPARIEVLVVRFQPEIVHGAGSVRADHFILLPFYCQIEERPHVLRARHPDAAAAHAALARMIGCYADAARSPYGQPGARVYFLELLYHLCRHVQAAERLSERFLQQQAQAGRLRQVFAYIAEHYAERISLPAMAGKAGLSKAQFYRRFKKAAGMPLVDYVTQLRLSHAARLLQEPQRSIAEIASATGFSDQSYFDRRFRRAYRVTPRQFRRSLAAAIDREPT